MKKIASVLFVLCIVLSFSSFVYAETYSTSDGDFTTNFWKEKYLGGDDGKPGNVLMAIGEGFIFQNAVLESVDNELGSADSPCGGGILPVFVTTYTGGELTLNPSGPWGDNIKIRDITATNLNGLDEGKRFFILSFSGTSESGVFVDVTAYFCEDDDNYERQETRKGKPVFQKGYNFDAVIEITYPQ